ncbi:MAG: sulfatase-like hydrolase/transferase [Saprospiraceae bacterium]
MTNKLLFLLFLATFGLGGCKSVIAPPGNANPPNVILIMADDMGYECLSSNGSLSYQTPVLDQIAAKGIRFTNCIAQPLCTPSRVKIMTGQYNFRNYENFGYLNPNQPTFGQFMKKAGYATAIAGKWQLNGLSFELAGYQDNKRPHHFGFDEYCLWQLTQDRKAGERFANPLIEQNGQLLERDENAYGPDIFANYVIDFITRNKEKPFFIYYPMVLVHNPFVPTPDSDAWTDLKTRSKQDTTYFKDMVAYTDKIVGRIQQHLQKLGLEENTILLFTGDNGTNRAIVSKTQDGPIYGFKGNTTLAGTHVPFIASWPAKIKKGKIHDGLISFSDFYPTLAALVGQKVDSDGQSFLPLLNGASYQSPETLMVHYDPRWGKEVNAFRNLFAQTTKYKLYQDGKMYDLHKDPLEQSPLQQQELTDNLLAIRQQLQSVLDQAPRWE